MENIISLEGQDAAHDNGIVQAAAELRITLENFRHPHNAIRIAADVLKQKLGYVPSNVQVHATFQILATFTETRELASNVLKSRRMPQVDKQLGVVRPNSSLKKQGEAVPMTAEIMEVEEMEVECVPEVASGLREHSEVPHVDHLIQVG